MGYIEAAGGVGDGCVSRPLSEWPLLPKPGDRAIDDIRFDLFDRCIVEAELRHHARSKVLDDHVRFGQHLAGNVLTRPMLEVYSDTAFASVKVAEDPAGTLRSASNVAALNRFDLNDIGAAI